MSGIRTAESVHLISGPVLRVERNWLALVHLLGLTATFALVSATNTVS